MEAELILSRVARRLRAYKRRFEMDNELIGRCVELAGDRVQLDGMRFSVDNPLIQTQHKSTILFGVYEIAERAFVRRYVRAGDAVIELGGSIGVVACTTNRMLADGTRHVVVEANPTLIPTLELNRDLNHARFTIVHAVVSHGAEFAEFTRTGHFLTGSANTAGEDRVLVKSTSLEAEIARLGWSPIVLISDIEGGEIDLIRNELPVVAEHVRTLVMETHPGVVGAQPTAEMLASLEEAGLVLSDRDGDVVVLRNRRHARRPWSEAALVGGPEGGLHG